MRDDKAVLHPVTRDQHQVTSKQVTMDGRPCVNTPLQTSMEPEKTPLVDSATLWRRQVRQRQKVLDIDSKDLYARRATVGVI